MSVEEAITVMSKVGMRLTSLYQSEDGWWVAGTRWNNMPEKLSASDTASGAILKAVENTRHL